MSFSPLLHIYIVMACLDGADRMPTCVSTMHLSTNQQ